MSRTYEIVCHDCKVKLWIGQGNEGKEYIYWTDKDRQVLRDFFFSHQNHRLEFGDSEPFSMLDYVPLDSDEVAERERTTIPKADYPKIVERYLAGESAYAISGDYKVTRNAIRQVLLLTGTPIRSQSSAAKLRAQRNHSEKK